MRVAQAETAGKNSFFLPRASFFNDVIEMDTFHLKWDDVKCKILAIIDVYSRFETNAIIQSETIEEELDIMQKQWISWAGFPKVIKTDSSEAHMSEYLQAWCDDKGIKLLLVPKETHHQLGLVERLHAVRRQQLYKMKTEKFDLKLETAGLHACDQRNGLRSVHRVSAVSIVFGYTPAQARISDEPMQDDLMDIHESLKMQRSAFWLPSLFMQPITATPFGEPFWPKAEKNMNLYK